MTQFFFTVLLTYLGLSLLNVFIYTSTLRINANEKSIFITTSLGDCQLQACGSSLFCASPNNGTCHYVNDTYSYCKCENGYTTAEEDNLYQCCYKQKSSFNAFMLEIFIGFGVGHFYVGNYLIGSIKCSVYAALFISTIVICIQRYRYKGMDSETSFLLKLFRTICFLLCGCTYVGWQMIDSVLFSWGGYTDSNKMDLY